MKDPSIFTEQECQDYLAKYPQSRRADEVRQRLKMFTDQREAENNAQRKRQEDEERLQRQQEEQKKQRMLKDYEERQKKAKKEQLKQGPVKKEKQTSGSVVLGWVIIIVSIAVILAVVINAKDGWKAVSIGMFYPIYKGYNLTQGKSWSDA